jgi:D-glycero-D-manno-heptose 1,7-bisphosphate phosphatase
MKRPAIFFDRDNTLIASNGYLGDPKRVQLVNGAADAVATARSIGFATVIFSNQSGVARGYFTEDDVRAVNRRIELLLRQQNRAAVIDRNEFCPEHPQAVVLRYRRDSNRRKPGPGMILAAAEALALDLPSSWVIGDAARDIAAGRAAGCRTIWFRDPTLTASPAASGQAAEPDFVVATLAEAINIVRTHPHHSSDFQAMPPLPEHSLSGTSPDPDEEVEPEPEPEPAAAVATSAPLAEPEPDVPQSAEPQSREAESDESAETEDRAPTEQPADEEPEDLNDDDHGAPPLILQAALAESRLRSDRSHAERSASSPASRAEAARPDAYAMPATMPATMSARAEAGVIAQELEEPQPIAQSIPEPAQAKIAEEIPEEPQVQEPEPDDEEPEAAADELPITEEEAPDAASDTPAAPAATTAPQHPGDFDQTSFDASITRLQKLTEQVIRQDLTRLEGLAEQILIEQKQSRSDQTQRGDFSVSKLLAGIALVLSLAAAFAAFLYRGDPTQVQASMGWAIFLLLLSIALLMISRDH